MTMSDAKLASCVVAVLNPSTLELLEAYRGDTIILRYRTHRIFVVEILTGLLTVANVKQL